MCARKGHIVFIAFCGLLLALCWQTSARAASSPPTIDDIVGTYRVTCKEVYYYFSDGIPVKENYVLTWRINKISDSRVTVQMDGWLWSFTAYYKNGFLVESYRGAPGPEYWVSLGIASFSGSRGKVKFKSDFGGGWYGASGAYCEWDPFKGKMISTDPGFVVGATLANQDDEQAAFAPEEEAVPLAVPPTFSIDDLVGIYSCTLSGAAYRPTAGTKETGLKASGIFTITKINDYTLNIDTWWRNLVAHYASGVLMVAEVDVDVLDPDARFAILLAKGKPGKISMKGKIFEIIHLETLSDEFDTGKVSCKQSSP